LTDYLLFIDTEASALPVKWTLPLTADSNWPHIVQVSWIIYDKNRSLIKKEDHYIKSDGFTITQSAIKTHGLTPGFLAAHGGNRNKILQLLCNDLLTYQPMIIGHFMRLDYYVLGADLYRSKLANPLTTLPVFCTMVATKHLVWNPLPRQLRLGELYTYLFGKDLQGQHNALVDAQATADCFFELLDRHEINESLIKTQTDAFEPFRDPAAKNKGCILPVLITAVLLLFILMIWIL